MSDANQGGLTEMLGGSEAPVKEALTTGADGGNPAGTTQSAPWMSQLSKELRDDAELTPKLSGFKTISDLARAYLNGGGEAADGNIDFDSVMKKLGAPGDGESYDFEESLEKDLAPFAGYAKKARLTPGQAEGVLNGLRELTRAREEGFLKAAKEAAPEVSKALVDEFGSDAGAYYRKAAVDTKLNTLLARSGLGANKDIARALVLLGREMSEDYTSAKSNAGGGKKPVSVKDGAMFSYK
jgi:hypothetical protein